MNGNILLWVVLSVWALTGLVRSSIEGSTCFIIAWWTALLAWDLYWLIGVIAQASA